jgi:hypothetical protein
VKLNRGEGSRATAVRVSVTPVVGTRAYGLNVSFSAP